MTVKSILEEKGHDVLTLGPNDKLSEAVRVLAENRVGALVITNGDRKIVGILSERDIVRSLAKFAGAALDQTIVATALPTVVADLGGASAGGRKAAKSKSGAAPKYRGPNGELWAGGPGRKPQWVRDALAAGKDLDAYKI